MNRFQGMSGESGVGQWARRMTTGNKRPTAISLEWDYMEARWKQYYIIILWYETHDGAPCALNYFTGNLGHVFTACNVKPVVKLYHNGYFGMIILFVAPRFTWLSYNNLFHMNFGILDTNVSFQYTLYLLLCKFIYK